MFAEKLPSYSTWTLVDLLLRVTTLWAICSVSWHAILILFLLFSSIKGPGIGAGHPLHNSSTLDNSSLYGYDPGFEMCDNGSQYCNGTLSPGGNGSGSMGDSERTVYALWEIILLGTLAGSTSIMTILGNLVVIISFIVERSVRQPTNYFIASLAVSDLLIGEYPKLPFCSSKIITWALTV